jgi:hypothetical protein
MHVYINYKPPRCCAGRKDLRSKIDALSQASEVAQLLEQLKDLEKAFNRASIYIPAYDQKTYMQVDITFIFYTDTYHDSINDNQDDANNHRAVADKTAGGEAAWKVQLQVQVECG